MDYDIITRLRGHAGSLDNKVGCLPWPDLYRDAAVEIERLRGDKEFLEGEVGSLGQWIEILIEALREVQWRDIASGMGSSAYPTCVGCGAKSFGALNTQPHDEDCPIEKALANAMPAEAQA